MREHWNGNGVEAMNAEMPSVEITKVVNKRKRKIMIRRIFNMAVLCSVLTLWWGCSSDSDNDGGSSEPQAEKPNWQLNLSAEDAAPDWVVTNAEDYELVMSLAVKLNPVLAQYASEDDVVAAFVGGVCRSVASPYVYSGGKATLASAGLSIVGNAGESSVTFKYYCKRLKRIFVLRDWMGFNPNMNPSQDGSAYVLPFETEGGLVSAQVTVLLPGEAAVNFAAGDEIAVLSEEGRCCSCVLRVEDRQVALGVLAPSGSRLCIGWYSAANHAIYEAAETFLLVGGEAKTVSVSSFGVKKR